MPNSGPIIGEPLDRVDGRAKVTGQARYAADQPIGRLAYAVAVTSTISKGHITGIHTGAAERVPGVLAVITSKNAPKMKTLSRHMKLTGQFGQTMAVLQDNEIHYGGQYIGLVVAESLTRAQHAARLLKFTYSVEKPNLDIAHPIGDLVKPKKVGRGEKPDSLRGDPDKAFAAAPLKIQQTYSTPAETHNPMEMHATIAEWNGDQLTLYDSTQHVLGVKNVTAAMINISPDQIEVISPFLGGGFGCKGSVWPNVALAAIAARRVQRPVKLVLTRQQMFTQVGHRPQTIQNISLGADPSGKLLSTSHETISQTSDFDEWPEPSSKQTSFLYSCPNLRTTQWMARVNAGTPCQMRAPGEASGTVGLEIGMDELAYAANIDPLELRLRNYSERDESNDKPYSSKALRECYKAGADKFGWSKRSMAPRSMRDGDVLIGWGMATATYPTNVSPSSARVRIYPDGHAIGSAATHDLGTGTYTIMTQIVAANLGIPVEKVAFELGDSSYSKAPAAGGSQTAASVGSAVQAAAIAALAKVSHLAAADRKSPLFGRDETQIVLSGDRVQLAHDASTGERLVDLFRRNGDQPVEATAEFSPSKESQNYSKHAWGAQFAEVRIDERLGEIRVSRFVGAFAAGKIINAKTGHSQIMGAIVWGIAMALHENTIYDPGSGRVLNENLADYLVPVNADIPPIDCFFVNEVDEHVNPLGAKGIGELGITGSGAAVANAVYHATGKRMRDLPITLDALL